jgi:hypothetical protein
VAISVAYERRGLSCTKTPLATDGDTAAKKRKQSADLGVVLRPASEFPEQWLAGWQTVTHSRTKANLGKRQSLLRSKHRACVELTPHL